MFLGGVGHKVFYLIKYSSFTWLLKLLTSYIFVECNCKSSVIQDCRFLIYVHTNRRDWLLLLVWNSFAYKMIRSAQCPEYKTC